MGLSEETVARIEALKDGDGTDDLIGFLCGLPPEADRNWELALTRLIEQAPGRRDDLGTIVKMDERDIDCEDAEFVRFSAFFARCTYHRRQGNVTTFGSLLRDHEEFSERGMYPHLQALHAKKGKTLQSYEAAIEHGREAVERIGEDHAGVAHSLAGGIARALEDEKAERLGYDPEALLAEAERYVKSAIDQSDYPKFKMTLGRILALQGDYDRALERIHEAIDGEDDAKDDYALRVINYRMYESRVRLGKYREQVEAGQREIENQQEAFEAELAEAIEEIQGVRDESKERLERLQAQTLQFLGFFSTLLAVVIATITIAVQFTLVEAASLIVVLTGGLFTAFGGFTIMLPIEDAREKSTRLALLGIGLLLVGFAMVAVVRLLL
ncbi:hypothetical protein [Salinigranum salinum]|uniref:hypothetical protein n=1 Tax=Salinigranum salinum TaxID=1364937 RepID=UPI0012607973|nr:hypothetical protein [Salinigranum salinum]